MSLQDRIDSRVALDVRGEIVPECGHFVPEEAPGFLNARPLSFVADDT